LAFGRCDCHCRICARLFAYGSHQHVPPHPPEAKPPLSYHLGSGRRPEKSHCTELSNTLYDLTMLLFVLYSSTWTIWRTPTPGPYKGMSSFISGLGSAVFNLCLTNSVHVYRRYITEGRECRRCRLSLAATADQISMTTLFDDLKYVPYLCPTPKIIERS
jgi:hypothetical protein